MKDSVARIIVILVIGGVFHYLWESLHVVLYTDYEHLTTLSIELYATCGDVMYVAFGLALLSVVRKTVGWVMAPTRADYVLLALIGLGIALFVEYKALMLGRWVYTEAMPIIPLLGVGLSPIVQMTLGLPLSVYIARKLSRD